MSNRLESIVRQYAALPPRVTPSGWYALRCPVCNDHKYKKRGGWKFEGEKTSYHCFNCGSHALYEDGGFFSDDMEKILDAFSIPDDVIKQFKFDSFKASVNKKQVEKAPATIKPVSVLSLPKHFYRLIQDEDDVWSQIAQEYLTTRGIDIDDYKFYLSRGGTKEENVWKKRLIIPIYRQQDLVFYQGRDLTETSKLKYLGTESAAKSTVIYGHDQLFKDESLPLYVVEGFFDAFHINGVAVFGNEMSPQQLSYLNASPRKKVVIPDRKGDGHKLALQGIDNNWSVSILPFGDCKDVNDAIVKYGKLFVMKTLVENTVSGLEATIRVNILCEKSKTNGKTKK